MLTGEEGFTAAEIERLNEAHSRGDTIIYHDVCKDCRENIEGACAITGKSTVLKGVCDAEMELVL